MQSQNKRTGNPRSSFVRLKSPRNHFALVDSVRPPHPRSLSEMSVDQSAGMRLSVEGRWKAAQGSHIHQTHHQWLELILGARTLQHRLPRLWRQSQIVQQSDGRNHRHTQECQLEVDSLGVPWRAMDVHGKA